MFKNKKFLIILIISVIILLIIISGLYFKNKFQTETDNSGSERRNNQEETPEDELKKVNFTLYNEDKTIKWELSSRSATRFEEQGVINLSPLTVNAYKIKNDHLFYSLTGKAGEYLYREQKLNVKGPVQMKGKDYHLTASKVIWNQQNNKIFGHNGVRITAPSFVMTGDYFQVDLGLEQLTVTGSEETRVHFKWKGKKNEIETD